MKKHEVGVKLTRENLEQMKYIFSLFRDEIIKYDWEDSLAIQISDEDLFSFNGEYWCVNKISGKEIVTPLQLLKIIQEEQIRNMPIILTIGKWYKLESGCIINYQGKKEGKKMLSGYGMIELGYWYNNDLWVDCVVREATEKEVADMLRKEAERRYGKDWEVVKIKSNADKSKNITINNGIFLTGTVIDNARKETVLWNRNGLLFYNGIWAEELDSVNLLEKGQWYRKQGTSREGWDGKTIITKFSGVYNKGINVGIDYSGEFSDTIHVYNDEYLNEYVKMSDAEIIKTLYRYGLKKQWDKNKIAKFVSKHI